MLTQGSGDGLIETLKGARQHFWRERYHLAQDEIMRQWESRRDDIWQALTGPSVTINANEFSEASTYIARARRTPGMARTQSELPGPRNMGLDDGLASLTSPMSRKLSAAPSYHHFAREAVQSSKARASGFSPRNPEAIYFDSRGSEAMHPHPRPSSAAQAVNLEATRPPKSSLTIRKFESCDNDPFTSFALASPAKVQRTGGRRPMEQVPENGPDVMVFEPDEYCNQPCLEDFDSLPGRRRSPLAPLAAFPTTSSFGSSFNSDRCYHTTNFQSPSQQSSILSPGFSPTFFTQDHSPGSLLSSGSTMTSNMSRQSSMGATSLCGAVNMLRFQSSRSDQVAEDSFSIESISGKQPDPPSLRGDSTVCFSFTGGGSQRTDTAPMVHTEPMTFAFSEDAYVPRAHSSVSHTLLESSKPTEIASGRPIQPKPLESVSTSQSSRFKDHPMLTVRSDDGSIKEVVLIPKQAHKSAPPEEKPHCTMCDKHPKGFRSEHELRRHTVHAHSTIRKVWICVDNSPGKTKLAGCKACRTSKTYGAYYNAAAHLRRIHFQPMLKGTAKGLPEEKRGGKGGGSHPSIKELKLWMRQVEEAVPQKEPDSTVASANTDLAGESAEVSDSVFGSDFEAARRQLSDATRSDVLLSFGDAALVPSSSIHTSDLTAMALEDLMLQQSDPHSADHIGSAPSNRINPAHAFPPSATESSNLDLPFSPAFGFHEMSFSELLAASSFQSLVGFHETFDDL